MLLVFHPLSPDDSSSRGGAGTADGDAEHVPELAGKLGNRIPTHGLDVTRETRRSDRHSSWDCATFHKYSSGTDRQTEGRCVPTHRLPTVDNWL